MRLMFIFESHGGENGARPIFNCPPLNEAPGHGARDCFGATHLPLFKENP
jgi:hypothetical protein